METTTSKTIVVVVGLLLLLILSANFLIIKPSSAFLSKTFQIRTYYSKKKIFEFPSSSFGNDEVIFDSLVDQLEKEEEEENESEDDEEIQNHLRFSGVCRLFNKSSSKNKNQANNNNNNNKIILHRLSTSTVVIVGLGGVGSWAAESICRSGIGHIILIDLDDICTSNTNRQLHTTIRTIGQMKVDVMKERLMEINPNCVVTAIHDFITIENAKQTIKTLHQQFNITACIDAMDGHFEKSAFIASCCQYRIPLVTCGGSAGKLDPTQIKTCDLTKVTNDPLLFKCRKRLRKFYGFEKGPKKYQKNYHRPKRWNVTAVFSFENVVVVEDDDEEEEEEGLQSSSSSSSSSLRRCDGSLGTASFVTGTYGFVAASRVVSMIANDELLLPSLDCSQY